MYVTQSLMCYKDLFGFAQFLCCLLSCIVVGHVFPSGEIAHKKNIKKRYYYYHCNVNELALPCIHTQAFTAHARVSVHSMHITALIHRCWHVIVCLQMDSSFILLLIFLIWYQNCHSGPLRLRVHIGGNGEGTNWGPRKYQCVIHLMGWQWRRHKLGT